MCAEDALSILKKNSIALIIADNRMPDMSGIELLEKALQKYPDTFRIILTAYIDDKPVKDALNLGYAHSCVSKPWEPDQMRAIVKKGIEIYKSTKDNTTYCSEGVFPVSC
jgi:DNA-binding NtrC family response regulator